MRALWLLMVLVVGSSGCDLFGIGSITYCPSKAVGIKVSFSGEAQRADQLQFRIWVDSLPAFITPSYSRKPGSQEERLEVEFTNYDAKRFHTVHVIAVAREKGVVIGTYKTEDTIEDKCTQVYASFSSTSSFYKYCAAASDCPAGVCPANGCCNDSSSCF
jgi:hypothetical protein